VGYIAFINGKGVQVQIDESGPHLVESVIKCEFCGDDRILEDGRCVTCCQIDDSQI
jgi:hypothetical protein